MKKILFIFTLFFASSLIAQKGSWLCKNYKVIDSTKGWRTGEVGLIIDFTYSKLRHLLKDTIIDVKINKSQNKIWFKI